MTRIEKLLNEMCPKGVVFQKLWTVTAWDKKFNAVENFKQAKTQKYVYKLASELRELAVPGGEVKLLNTGAQDFGFTTKEVAGDSVAEGEVVSIPWGGTPSVQYYKGSFVTGDNRIAQVLDRQVLETKFLYYVLLSRIDELGSFYRGSGIKHPSMAHVLEMSIPLPPIEVQQEIVRILDTFTDLEAELEAELESRKKQYEHYSSTLLDFPKGSMKWVALGDIATFEYGFTDIASDEGPIRYIRISDISPAGHLEPTGAKYIQTLLGAENYSVSSGDLLVARTGASFGKTLLVGEEQNAVFASFLIRIKFPSNQMNPAFYWHFAKSSHYWTQAERLVSRAGQPQFNANALKQILVPIPDLKIQLEISNVLDKLDSLVTDFKDGLPAEILARRKQYEHYRERLLTFKELAA
jgi:type I restriction enzyme S subunit